MSVTILAISMCWLCTSYMPCSLSEITRIKRYVQLLLWGMLSIRIATAPIPLKYQFEAAFQHKQKKIKDPSASEAVKRNTYQYIIIHVHT